MKFDFFSQCGKLLLFLLVLTKQPAVLLQSDTYRVIILSTFVEIRCEVADEKETEK